MGVTASQAAGRSRGKVVLVTGAARGIGAAIARELAAAGARLALVGLEPELLREVAASCGEQASAWEADVTDTDALRAAIDGVVERYGGIDVVIANAGVAPAGFVRSMDTASFERTIEVNVLGVWRTVRAALPHVIERRGYVLVVSSAAALVHLPGMAAYAASKAAIEAFADSLRAEVRHLGVDVGVAYFSWIRTDMVNSADEHPVFGPMRSGIPGIAGRVYSPEAAARAVSRGLARRAATVYVPSALRPLRQLRGMLPWLVGLGSRRLVPTLDRAAERDVASRGAAASRLMGPGGRAASRGHDTA